MYMTTHKQRMEKGSQDRRAALSSLLESGVCLTVALQTGQPDAVSSQVTRQLCSRDQIQALHRNMHTCTRAHAHALTFCGKCDDMDTSEVSPSPRNPPNTQHNSTISEEAAVCVRVYRCVALMG